jgi:glutathione S-transferase
MISKNGTEKWKKLQIQHYLMETTMIFNLLVRPRSLLRVCLKSITIPDTYNWILLEAVIIAFQVVAQGFRVPRIRTKLFNKKFFETHFPQLIKDEKYPREGYPDMGDGRFSQKLSFDDWRTFANYQRAHYNYLEQVASILIFLLVSGLSYPRVSAALGLAWIVGRAIYAEGYIRNGASGRRYGGILIAISQLGLFLMAICACTCGAGGFAGFAKFCTGGAAAAVAAGP